jgi:hypothetical protein
MPAFRRNMLSPSSGVEVTRQGSIETTLFTSYINPSTSLPRNFSPLRWRQHISPKRRHRPANTRGARNPRRLQQHMFSVCWSQVAYSEMLWTTRYTHLGKVFMALWSAGKWNVLLCNLRILSMAPGVVVAPGAWRINGAILTHEINSQSQGSVPDIPLAYKLPQGFAQMFKM